jgi:hypothetical protein
MLEHSVAGADGTNEPRQRKTSVGHRCSKQPINQVMQPQTATIALSMFDHRDREPSEIQSVD